MNQPFVLDASVPLAWALQEPEHQAYNDAVLTLLGDGEALVPSLWAIEIVNVLVHAERGGRLTSAALHQFVHDLAALPVREVPNAYHGSAMLRLHQMCFHRGLTAYDATYLDLALRNGCLLATTDRKLVQAAMAEGCFLDPLR
ncbi:MAG TPA: type II toxin-antitoxin system VapC family toxin [Armatimonadota bacterium]